MIDKFILPHSQGKREIFLTFDDGPSATADNTNTNNLLNLLAKYKISATFFVVGNCVLKEKALATKIVQKGHSLGNHTYNHKNISSLPYREIIREIDTCQRLIDDLQPKYQYLFRPPRGLLGLRSLFILLRKKYKIVLWSLDSLDSHTRCVEYIVNRLMEVDVGGKIILFHDDADIALQALEILIPFWLKQNFTFSKL